LRRADKLWQLKAAERALTSHAMVAPPASVAKRGGVLDECLHSIGAVMATLRH
jgi:hypothetical protein